MAVANLVSVEEYLNTVYEPDCDYVNGELVERNAGETDHSALLGLLGAWLFSRRKELGIHVFSVTRVQVAPRRVRVPDLAVTTSKAKGRILREPPLLCVEILSPEDRVSRVEDRIGEYLRMGVLHVWLIDPRAKRAWSYASGGTREPVRLLTTASPRIELPIDEIFAELEEEIDLSET